MRARKVNIGTTRSDYWFYDCEVEFERDEIAVTGDDATFVVRVSEITMLKIETED